ncbi:MAG: cation transporter [Acidimicrobiia bacterium]
MDRAAVLTRRGLRLEYATLAWNLGEVIVLVAAAVSARSVALAGFALDSGIEIYASLIVVWHLRGSADAEREHRAVRRIGTAFLGLAAFIAAQTVATLAAGIRPDSSALGIGWLSVTVVAMYGLAAAKRSTGRETENVVLLTEAEVTFVDGSLALAILVGLVLNAALGWWWADLAGGVVLIGYGVKEGLEALRRAADDPPDAG